MALLLLFVQLAGLTSFGAPAPSSTQLPNILFIIMDDVGVDQMQIFGYGGLTPPPTPNMNVVANSGIRFHNTWSMPACSTSRAVFFTGRFPFRTSVFNALGPHDLANSQVSPFEMTTPKLLKGKGYQSALFGKFHLGLQGKNPYGYAMPKSLGWDYFYGWLDDTGDPSSIDTNAGLVSRAANHAYSCGFVPGKLAGGVDEGPCYSADRSCKIMTTVGTIPPGRACMDSGGILDPYQKECQSTPPDYIDFTRLNAHYVSPLVINYPDGRVERVAPTDIRSRTYRGVGPVNEAISWINGLPKGTPWMATVSFATVHTPIMQPPPELLPADAQDTSSFNCSNTTQQRVLSNQMIQALDTELGRLLLNTGLATLNPDGTLNYDPAKTNTMIVIVGDNGTLGFTVKQPFDPNRAKGTAYQTGVWVPLIVSGPLVKQPNRDVDAMVNIADLFQLFGEVAGIDVHKEVPRTVDSQPLLPYLTNPGQTSVRTNNFTQIDLNYQANGQLNGPCSFTSTCSQIPVTKSVCEDNAGTWWGPGADAPITMGIPPTGLKYCCNVNQFLAQKNMAPFTIQPLSSVGIRNDDYKIVTNFTQDYDADTNSCVPTTTNEFYKINEDVPLPRIDRAKRNLLKRKLTKNEQEIYDDLWQQLQTILHSQPPCPGDGNIDGKVNQKDVSGYNKFVALAEGKSSWFDFDLNGKTDSADLQIIQDHLGANCN